METNLWREIGPRAAVCSQCAASLQVEGLIAFSCVFKTEAGFSRQEYCDSCFGALAEKPYVYWRCKSLAVDDAEQGPSQQGLVDLFSKLGEDEQSPEPARQSLRYLVALALVRERKFRLVELARVGGADCLVLRASGDAEMIRVPAPDLSDEDLSSLAQAFAAELGR